MYMYGCVCLGASMPVYIHECVHVFTCYLRPCLYMWKYLCMYMYVSRYVLILCTFMCVCTYLRMYICVCVWAIRIYAILLYLELYFTTLALSF